MLRSLITSLGSKAKIVIGLMAILLVVATASAPGFAQSATPAHSSVGMGGQLVVGKADFDANCASCHGKDGKGAGPDTNVIAGIKPADLTTIAARNGGVFPAAQVADTIDGRASTPSHKRFDMPFWGVNFQESGKEFTPESEAKAKARIDMIITYIKTMQVK